MKEIKGFEGYFVTEDGKVFSNKSGRLIELSLYENPDGYYVVNLWKGGKSFHRRVNRLVASAFIPNPHNFPVVHHKDDDRKNNCVDNLEWCTSQQNNAYKVMRKRHSYGESHGGAELSEELVLEIYLRLMSGAELSIAKEYNISQRTVSRIKSKEIWKHVLENLPEIPIKEKKPPLSEDQVKDICQRLQDGETQTQIADRYCVDRQVIYRIHRGISFKYISSKYNFS